MMMEIDSSDVVLILSAIKARATGERHNLKIGHLRCLSPYVESHMLRDIRPFVYIDLSFTNNYVRRW